MVIAAVTSLMIGLVMLRFCTNFLIDCCILNERERAQRDLIRSLCPWYHRRTQPTSELPNDEPSTPIDIIEAVPSGIRKERLMNALPLFHLSADIIKDYKDKDHKEYCRKANGKSSLDRGDETTEEHDENGLHFNTSAVICSICIHELNLGDTVFKTPHCHHLFHRNCISEWMTAVTRSNNTECPNCRSVIIARAVLNRILLGEHSEQEHV